jgi:ABC-type transport system involved in multi-copper enzyme maturation permease subunit
VIRLVRMEILRLWSRRLVKLAASGVLLLITVIVVIDGVHHSKGDAAAFAKFRQEKLAAYDKAKADFEAQKGQPGGPPSDSQFGVSRQQIEAHPEQGCFDQASCELRAPKAPYVTRTALSDFGKAVAVICAFAAFLIGASAAGAEWSAGTMQSLLYWEPRRARVVLAKVIGLVAVVAMLVVVAESLFTALAFAAGQTRGTTAGLTAGVWSSHLLLVGRAVLFAGFAAVLGFSIAFATRVTAAAVGIAFVYFAILERLLVAWKIWLARYTIGPLLGGWLNNGINTVGRNGRPLALTGVRAGVTLASYAAVMLGAATLWFRQRDVT